MFARKHSKLLINFCRCWSNSKRRCVFKFLLFLIIFYLWKKFVVFWFKAQLLFIKSACIFEEISIVCVSVAYVYFHFFPFDNGLPTFFPESILMYFLLTSHLWCKSWWSHGLWYYVSMAIVVQTPLYLHRFPFFDSPTLADHSTPQLVFFLATPASHLLEEKFLIQTDLQFIGFYFK